MVGASILWGALAISFSPLSPAAWEDFELVMKLKSPNVAERERIQAQLTAPPGGRMGRILGKPTRQRGDLLPKRGDPKNLEGSPRRKAAGRPRA
jgi:hypothetical protein